MDNLSEYDVIELQQDNLGGIRSKIDVIAAILHICISGSLKNHIIGKGNLSDSMTNHYLTILLYHNLLENYINGDNNRTYYKTTPRGKKIVYHYNQIQKLFTKEKNNTTSTEQLLYIGRSAFTHLTKRILIIDDEPDITSALKNGMEDYGVKIDVFNDPIFALSNYNTGSYDLIILDVKMPKMNGFELYNLIRKLDGQTRICFWTAFDVCYEELRKSFPTMDEKFFIRKPITMNDLADHIEKITNSSPINESALKK